MKNSIRAVYTGPKPQKDINQLIKTFDKCQQCKKQRKKKYRLLPAKEPEVKKWQRVNVDLWGAKTVHNKNEWDYKVHVMTMVDSVTGWFELNKLYGKPTAFQCQQILDSAWLARYPTGNQI